MSRRPYEYLLSLGSNIEPERWVPAAIAFLRGRLDVRAVSPRYDVPAVGGEGEQPPYVNLAARVATDLPPRALRETCRSIETLCRRVRTDDPFAPRTLDLDVVLGDATWEGEGLPADDLTRESYVLVPSAAIWPDARDPLSGRTLRELADERFPSWDAAHRRPEDA